MSSNINDYEKLEKIGFGTYGKVYKARIRRTGEIVALKKIRLEATDNEEWQGVPSTALREIALLQTIECPHVIRLMNTCNEETSLTMVLEYIPTDLKKHMDVLIEEGERLPASTVKRYMWQLVNGMYYLHRCGVMHRDLKPQNLLVDVEARVLKIADLGLGRAFTPPLKALTHEVVTLWYRPPEVLLGTTHYNTSIDMWGVGCILAEMAEMATLLPGTGELHQLLEIFKLRGTPSEATWPGLTALQDWHVYPDFRAVPLVERCPHLGADGLDLLEGLLQLNPAKRMDARAALNHPYFDEMRSSASTSYKL